MKNLIYKGLFSFIILIAIFFRFYNLNSAPPSPTVDEVSIGYNAYSILKTGADEYGYSYPLLLRAYDDWRPALYVYLVIPFVSLFGLDVVSVRLPSVILSVLTVISVYFLTRELTRHSPKIKLGKFELDIPLVTMALFAVSPWDIYISRLGHEVNASYSFLIFAITFFLLFANGAFKKLNWLALVASSLFFALSFDSYQSTKIVAPLVALTLVVLYFKKIWVDKKALIASLIVGVLVAFPVFLTSFDENALIRFKGTNLLSNSESFFEAQTARYYQGYEAGDTFGRVFDNNKIAQARLLSHAYLSHLDPVWLFVNEGTEQFKAPTLGLMYYFELPLLLLGFLFLLRSGIGTKNVIFIILWGIFAIIPGAITNGYAHPMRIFSVLPIPQIIAAIGFIALLEYILKTKKLRTAIVAISVFIYIFFTLWFFHSYFELMPRELSKHFQYGVLDALAYTSKVDKDYKKVIVTNSDNLFESYMFYLYLHKVDPKLYQNNGGTVSGGFAEEHRIGKYEFVNNVNGEIIKDNLYVITPSQYRSGDMQTVKSIKFKDGKVALLIVEKRTIPL